MQVLFEVCITGSVLRLPLPLIETQRAKEGSSRHMHDHAH
jgi:hypothetical protein